jgi:hypothetical protein
LAVAGQNRVSRGQAKILETRGLREGYAMNARSPQAVGAALRLRDACASTTRGLRETYAIEFIA